MNIGVSIVVPVYNAKDYLERCISHLISQSMDNIEIILVDDGSVDNSLNLCNFYAERDNRIRVYHQSNSGPAAARNSGMRIASGKWICFVDPDDYVDVDYCKASYDFGEKSGADIVMFDAVKEGEHLDFADKSMVITSTEDILDIRCDILYPYMIGSSGNIHVKKLQRFGKRKDIPLAAPWNKLYKRSFLCDNNLQFPQELKTLDDMTFNFVAFGYARKVAYLHRELYYYCFNKKSITNKYDPERISKDTAVFRMISEYISDNNICEGSDERNCRLVQAYYARVIKSFAILCRLCFFNNNSSKTLKQQLSFSKETMNMEIYKEAFQKIDTTLLEPRLKAVVLAVRCQNPYLLYILYLLQKLSAKI